MCLKRIVFLLVFGIKFVGFSQAIFLGLRLSASIGSHQHYYGVGVHAGLEYRSFMLTIGSDVSYRLKDLGQRNRFLESKSYLGASLVSGKNTSVRDIELGALNNYFTRENSFGYAYIIYTDNAGTSQLSGAFKGEIKGHSLKLERLKTASTASHLLVGMELSTGLSIVHQHWFVSRQQHQVVQTLNQ